MNYNRVGPVLIAALISSVISGALWAKMLSISTALAGISSIIVGILIGLSVLLVGRTRKIGYRFRIRRHWAYARKVSGCAMEHTSTNPALSDESIPNLC